MEYSSTYHSLFTRSGFHIESLEKEFEKTLPDKGEIVKHFVEVLDSLSITLPIGFNHEDGCQCLTFLHEHLPQILSLEEKVHKVLEKDILLDERVCWVRQRRGKYYILQHSMAGCVGTVLNSSEFFLII